MSEMNTKDFFIGSLIGGIVGASAALLLAPKSGRELRSDITEGAQTARERTSEFTSDAYEKGSEWASFAKEKSSSLAKNVSEQSNKWYGRVKEVAKRQDDDEKTADELADELSNDLGAAETSAMAESVESDVRQLHASTEEGATRE
ncbi:YtxH domain-containing protein [Bacillus piscicola]|uniref:YtxH domain-containing protein n=1 Tax=Bacillus piscicola TaxID=1632684 RepID=UPI001F09D526|nr:YtxH domain-containing protein [Bacillus piscicola]